MRELVLAAFVGSCASPPEETKEIGKAVVEHWRARDREAVVRVEEVKLDGKKAEARVRFSFPAFHSVTTVKTVKLVRTAEGWKVRE